MYTYSEFLYPYLQYLSPDVQQLEEYCKSQKPIASLDNLIKTSTIMEYDLGGEGDLFKAPEPIIGEPIVNLDNMTAADIELIQNDQILSDVLYECEKDLMTSSATDAAMSDILDIKIPFMRIDDSQIEEQKPLPDSPFQKSVSSGSLTSMDWVPMKPNFLDFPGMDLSIYGMRRAFSEGDIKGNGNVNIVHSPVEQPLYIGSCISEYRKEQLSRYRNKKSKRNFGRKIKYACRKALADSQPRVRGRFARTEESETLKRQQSIVKLIRSN